MTKELHHPRPEIDLEADMILVTGPMSSGKTYAPVEAAVRIMEDEPWRNLQVYRPGVDTRDTDPVLRAKNGLEYELPATIVESLGGAAVVDAADLVVLDEPFMWSDAEATSRFVQNALFGVRSMGARLVVSTLDRNYMGQVFQTYADMYRWGSALPKERGFSHHVLTGFCELCPDEDDLQPSTMTSLYRERHLQLEGEEVIVEGEGADDTYVSSCEDCRSRHTTLPADFIPLNKRVEFK